MLSASILSSSIYFLYRITTFPELGNVDAMLIGAALTAVLILCLWGITSGRGNVVECSLLVRRTPSEPGPLADYSHCSLPTSRYVSIRSSPTTNRPSRPKTSLLHPNPNFLLCHQSSWLHTPHSSSFYRHHPQTYIQLSISSSRQS